MAPSVKALTTSLRAAVKQVFDENRQQDLTVNNIRQTVAENLNLDADFFKSKTWKEKSKNIITTYHGELMEKEDELSPAPDIKPAEKEKITTTKNRKKRTSMSTSKNSGSVKRQKKEHAPESMSELASPSEVESEVSVKPKVQKGKRASTVTKKVKRKDVPDPESVKDEESEEEPKPKTRPAVKVRSLQGSVGPKLESVEDPLGDEDPGEGEGAIGKFGRKELKPKIRKSAVKVKVKKLEDSQSELSDLSDVSDEEPKSKRKKSIIKAEVKIKADSESELSDLKDETPEIKSSKAPKITRVEDDESEMSDVIDEEPKPKSQRKSKSGSTTSRAKPKSASSSTKIKVKPKTKAVSADLTPEEVELKTLQSQLVKCGIKKIWGIHLKKFGDDSKAKTRHLKDMLKDAGMTGRFSNEKAAEIKEMRELAADVEAVREGEEKWGMGSGRESRSAAKSGKLKYKIASNLVGDEEEEDSAGSGKGSNSDSMEEGDASESEMIKDRAATRNDLAFLGSEDEDSD